jgi:methylation protein EvaC
MSPAKQASCRVCGDPIAAFMTFGRMPIANGFLAPDAIGSEFLYDLAPAFCAGCAAFQLIEQPPAALMFHDRYPFYSGTSARMADHFKAFAADVTARARALEPDPLIVEIGSNDGTMLRHVHGAGLRCLGVEPSANVAEAARIRGLDTVSSFFTREVAAEIRERSGRAAVIVAANVICHVAEVHDLLAGVRDLLAPGGLFIFEDPYLGEMIARTAYDQIYDEHVFMWCATSVSRALAPHGLELIDVQPQPTHGGSMRYVCAPAGRYPVAASVEALRAAEIHGGLTSPATYEQFRLACEASRQQFRDLLIDLREHGKQIAGYGATSKSTTVLNYCGISASLISYIADTTPMKHHTLTPGTYIPVRPHHAFTEHPPDYAVLFAWNHAPEIFAKEQAFAAAGGKWITFVPALAILD